MFLVQVPDMYGSVLIICSLPEMSSSNGKILLIMWINGVLYGLGGGWGVGGLRGLGCGV